MSDKVVVRFLKAWRGYSVDELAGFDPEVVEGLKAKGFAEVHEGEGGTASKPKAAKSSGGKSGGAKSGEKAEGGNSTTAGPVVPPSGTGGGDTEAKP